MYIDTIIEREYKKGYVFSYLELDLEEKFSYLFDKKRYVVIFGG